MAVRRALDSPITIDANLLAGAAIVKQTEHAESRQLRQARTRMDDPNLPMSRRTIFVAGSLAAFGVAAARAAAAGPEGTTLQKSNVQLVKDFCAAWGDASADAEKIVNQYLADDCLVRFGDSVAPVSGHAPAVTLFQTFLGNGERYELKILETFAHGPVVVNARTDSTIKDSRRANPTSVVGVFVIKDGKIKEWSDYV